MIQPNELRIGNLLQDKVSKTLLEVIELNKEDITTYVIDRSKFPLKEGWGLEPIPLTEEWLLKLGLENKCILERDYFKHIELPQLEFLNQGCDFKVFDSGEVVLTTIKYVHQLQNFYHALTGKELTIKQ